VGIFVGLHFSVQAVVWAECYVVLILLLGILEDIAVIAGKSIAVELNEQS